MANVLVTGATGFVGRALCPVVQASAHHLRAAVRNADSCAVEDCCTIDVISGNTDWKACLEGMDVVIHLAARVHVMEEDDADAMDAFLEVNLYGTEQLARQAAAKGVKRFIYLSSIKVNGECTQGQAFNEHSIPSPHDAYAISKYRAEQALQRVAAETGIEVVILRPPLIYGPGVKANFYNLLKLVDSGLPLPFAKLQNRRSLLYVGNLVDALMLCISHPDAAGETFLVSDGEAVPTSKLIQQISKALGRSVRLFPMPLKLFSVIMRLIGKASVFDRLTQSLVIDSTKLHTALRWRPPYSLAQGIQITTDWYRNSN
jgi:nucleoside-diphosphate-sugar epimerase